MSPDGYISITGRIKDLIIRGGENIHPLEIENCLLAHPAVGDVSVVGVPDEKYGEVVGAFIITKEADKTKTPPEDDIRNFVREKLSNHLGMFFSCLVSVSGLLICYCSSEIRLLPPAN